MTTTFNWQGKYTNIITYTFIALFILKFIEATNNFTEKNALQFFEICSLFGASSSKADNVWMRCFATQRFSEEIAHPAWLIFTSHPLVYVTESFFKISNSTIYLFL